MLRRWSGRYKEKVFHSFTPWQFCWPLGAGGGRRTVAWSPGPGGHCGLTADTLLSSRVIRVKRQTGDIEMQDSGVSDIGACRLHSSAYCVHFSAALLFVLSRIKCFTRKDITANSIQEHDFLQPVVSKSMNSQCSALLLCSVLTGGGVVTSYWNWSWHSRGVTIVIITTHSLPQMVQKCCENVAKRELTVSVKIHFQYYQWMTWCCCLKYWYCVWHW